MYINACVVTKYLKKQILPPAPSATELNHIEKSNTENEAVETLEVPHITIDVIEGEVDIND